MTHKIAGASPSDDGTGLGPIQGVLSMPWRLANKKVPSELGRLQLVTLVVTFSVQTGGRQRRVFVHSPAMLARFSLRRWVRGSPGGRARSQRSTVSRSIVVASVSRPTP